MPSKPPSPPSQVVRNPPSYTPALTTTPSELCLRMDLPEPTKIKALEEVPCQAATTIAAAPEVTSVVAITEEDVAVLTVPGVASTVTSPEAT